MLYEITSQQYNTAKTNCINAMTEKSLTYKINNDTKDVVNFVLCEIGQGNDTVNSIIEYIVNNTYETFLTTNLTILQKQSEQYCGL